MLTIFVKAGESYVPIIEHALTAPITQPIPIGMLILVNWVPSESPLDAQPEHLTFFTVCEVAGKHEDSANAEWDRPIAEPGVLVKGANKRTRTWIQARLLELAPGSEDEDNLA